MHYEFTTTGRIHFGPGVLETLGEQARRLGGRRAWLVTGSRSLEGRGVVDRLERDLLREGISVVRYPVCGEPDTTVVDHGAGLAREAGADIVVAIGGGSALDAAKAIACLVANGGECLDYLEVVGRGRPIERPSLPVIAIPTTAGTGSEATRNAVITYRDAETKASLRSVHLLPSVALCDPELTHSMPAEATAATGLDALTQCIEPYTSRREHPLVDALAPDAIRRIAEALPIAYREPGNAAARAEMLHASTVSGICLAHAGLGASHAFASPLGGSFPVPHGFACAATLPHAMAANLRVAVAKGAHGVIARFARVAEALGCERTGDDVGTAEHGVARVRAFCKDMAVPSLARFGVTHEAIASLVERAKRTSSMKANPVALSDEELAGVLERAIALS